MQLVEMAEYNEKLEGKQSQDVVTFDYQYYYN